MIMRRSPVVAGAILALSRRTGVSRERKPKDVDTRKKQDQSMMPDGLADALTPERLAD
jgi:hypothetical protein